jgi:predicted nucleic acid-binding protein
MPEPASSEVILCDSSFVSVQERASRDPAAVAHWPRDTVARLNAGVLAISIFALAELRAGRVHGRWQQKRCDAQEARLAAFLTVPLDRGVVARYVDLHAWNLRGHPTPHNDLWIAATAMSRGVALVSCDRHFDSIAQDHDLQHIYLPQKP